MIYYRGNTHCMSSLPPLWKQLTGAFIGALAALFFYGVYEVSAPLLLAYIPMERGLVTERRFASEYVPDNTQKAFARIAERARKFAEENEVGTVPEVEEVLEADEEESISEDVEEGDLGEEDVMVEETVHVVDPEESPPPKEVVTPLASAVVGEHLSQTPELSDSGLALWSVVMIALGSAVFFRRKGIKSMFCRV